MSQLGTCDVANHSNGWVTIAPGVPHERMQGCENWRSAEPSVAPAQPVHEHIGEQNAKMRDHKYNAEIGEGVAPAAPVSPAVDDQIKHMVNRFLGWKLPANFNPDAGISFKATFNENTEHPMKHEPTGTNLFDATQAEVMVRYMIDGLPTGAASAAAPDEQTECAQRPNESDHAWLVRMLKFHRASHDWFIKNPQTSQYLGDADFHRMVVQRYERMIAIAVAPPRAERSDERRLVKSAGQDSQEDRGQQYPQAGGQVRNLVLGMMIGAGVAGLLIFHYVYGVWP